MSGVAVTLIICIAKYLPCVLPFTLCALVQHTFYCLLLSVCPSQKCFLYFLFFVSVVAAAVHDTDDAVSGHWYTDRKFTISVTAVLIVLPLSIPKEIGFQKYARYNTVLLAHRTLSPRVEIGSCFLSVGLVWSSCLGCVLHCSALSVMGTWYVTIVVIIKYIWPDKNMTPSHVPPRWVCTHLMAIFKCTPTYFSTVHLLIQAETSAYSACFACVAKSLCLLQFCFLDCSFQCSAHHLLWFPGTSSFVSFEIIKLNVFVSGLILVTYLCVTFFLLLSLFSATSAACRFLTAWAEKISKPGEWSSLLVW